MKKTFDSSFLVRISSPSKADLEEIEFLLKDMCYDLNESDTSVEITTVEKPQKKNVKKALKRLKKEKS